MKNTKPPLTTLAKYKQVFRFIGEFDHSSSTWKLSDDQIHHMIKVLRHNINDPIELCNGKGTISYGKIIKIINGYPQFFLEKTIYMDIPSPKISIFVDGDINKDASVLIPTLSELSINQLLWKTSTKQSMHRSNKQKQRLQKIAFSSLKQTKSPYLIDLYSFNKNTEFEQYIEAHRKNTKSLVLVLDITAETTLIDVLMKKTGFLINTHKKDHQSKSSYHRYDHYIFCLGGRSGFTNANLQILSSFLRVNLGKQILKVNTAIISCAVLAKELIRHLNTNTD